MCARRTLWVPRGLLLVRRPEGLVTCELMGVVRRGILILQHRRACAARSRAESGADMQARASRTVRAHGGVAATVEAGRPTRRPRGAAAAARASAAEAERAGSRLTHKATSATACTNRCAGCCGTGTGTGHGRGHGSGRGRGRSRRGAGCTRGRAVACVRARARTKAPEVCQSQPARAAQGPSARVLLWDCILYSQEHGPKRKKESPKPKPGIEDANFRYGRTTHTSESERASERRNIITKHELEHSLTHNQPTHPPTRHLGHFTRGG